MSRYIFFEKPHKPLVFLFCEGRAGYTWVSSGWSTQKPFRNTMPLAEENWAYSRFCILSFLNVRPSHFFLIIFKHQPLGQQKATGRHRSQSAISTLSPELGLVVFCQVVLKMVSSELLLRSSCESKYTCSLSNKALTILVFLILLLTNQVFFIGELSWWMQWTQLIFWERNPNTKWQPTAATGHSLLEHCLKTYRCRSKNMWVWKMKERNGTK